MGFGVYDVFNRQNLDSIGTIIANCTNNKKQPETITITLGPSAGSNSIANRKMQKMGGGDTLDYNLFLDASYSLVWGDTVGLNAYMQPILSGVGGNQQVTITVFGRIPAGQDVSEGNYTDVVTATIMP